jgi:GNAT superfamily N-acetyltransferase
MDKHSPGPIIECGLQVCPLAQLRNAPNLDALLSEYAQESKIAGLPAVNPDWDLYGMLEARGLVTFIGAFADGILVGFLIMLCAPNPHIGQIVANSDCYFVAKTYRKRGAGLRLLHLAEELARARGAIGFIVSAPIGGCLEKVMPHVGFRETNRIFFKEL